MPVQRFLKNAPAKQDRATLPSLVTIRRIHTSMKKPHCCRIPLWRMGATLIAYLCLALSTRAWSQALPPESTTRHGLVTRYQPIPASPFIPGTVPQGQCDTGYWLISSRHCKDQLECNQPCDFAVYHFDGQSGGRLSSLEELYGSLVPQIPVCIMIHGSFVVWESALTDSAGTYRWLRNAAPDRPVQMIFYTWPSDQTTKLLPNAIDMHDARVMGMRAELNSVYLTELISRVPESSPICLMGHSHGARMVSATLHLLAGGVIDGRCIPAGAQSRHRIRAVLAAAALDHDWFNPGERYEHALCRAEAAVNLRNRHDLPLIFHPTHSLFAARSLGRAGVTRRDETLLGHKACRMAECDVTDYVKCRHFWPYYYRQPAIASAIRHFVYFDD